MLHYIFLPVSFLALSTFKESFFNESFFARVSIFAVSVSPAGFAGSQAEKEAAITKASAPIFNEFFIFLSF